MEKYAAENAFKMRKDEQTNLQNTTKENDMGRKEHENNENKNDGLNQESTKEHELNNDNARSDNLKDRNIVAPETPPNNVLRDPTAFWLAWNERKNICFDENDRETKHESGCNCFEGMGSVM